MFNNIHSLSSIFFLVSLFMLISCNTEVIEESIEQEKTEEIIMSGKNSKKNNLIIYVEGWSCVYRIELSEEGRGRFVRGFTETENLGNGDFLEVYESYSLEILNTNDLDSINSVVKTLLGDVRVVDNSKMNDEKRILLKYNKELRIDAYNISGAEEIYKVLQLINPYLKENFVDICR